MEGHFAQAAVSAVSRLEHICKEGLTSFEFTQKAEHRAYAFIFCAKLNAYSPLIPNPSPK